MPRTAADAMRASMEKTLKRLSVEAVSETRTMVHSYAPRTVLRLVHPHWQCDHRLAHPLEALLQGLRRLVMQQPVPPPFPLEDQLAHEERRPRELLGDAEAQRLGLLDHLGPQGVAG